MDNTKKSQNNNSPKPNQKSIYNAKHAKEIETSNLLFRERLQTARKIQNLTQEELAQKLDISLATYRKYEQSSGNRADAAFFLSHLQIY